MASAVVTAKLVTKTRADVNVSRAAPGGPASRRPKESPPSEPLTFDPPIRVRGGRSTRSDGQIRRQGQPRFRGGSLTRRGAMPVRRQPGRVPGPHGGLEDAAEGPRSGAAR